MEGKKSIVKTVSFLSLLVLAYAIGMDIYLPGIPQLRDYFHTTQFQVQLTLSVFVLMGALGQLAVGPFCDSFGRRRVVLVSAALFTCASLLCSFAASIYWLIFFRFIQAIAASGLYLCAGIIIRDVFIGENITRAIGYLNIIGGLSPLIAPLVGSLILSQFKWTAIFYCLAIFGLVSWLIFYYKLVETNKRNKIGINVRILPSLFMQVLKNNEFLFYLSFSAIGNSLVFLIFSVSPYLLINKLNIGVEKFGLYFSGVTLCSLAGCMAILYFLKRADIIKLLQAGWAFLLISTLILAICWLSNSFSLGLYYLIIGLMSFSASFLVTGGNSGALQQFDENLGIVNSLINCINFSSAFLFTSIIMYFPVENLWALSIGCLVMVSSLAILLLVRLQFRQ